MGLRHLIKKLIYGYRCDEETYLRHLRSLGARIGEDVHLFPPTATNIDCLNAHLISIGDHVNIVSSTILTHDYAWSVVKSSSGEISGNQKPVSIGSHVFIGDGSLILCGSTIEDHVIIGARSVVSGRCESNWVYGGNPARKIMPLEQYRQRRRDRQLEEAREVVRAYRQAHGCFPPEEVLHEYFYLFTRDPDRLNPVFEEKLSLGGNPEQSRQFLREHPGLYDSYAQFLQDFSDS